MAGTGTVRVATPDDLEAIVRISFETTKMDESFVYRFPHRDQYPQDFERFTRLRWAHALANEDGRGHVMVYEYPTNPEDPSSTSSFPIAFSNWILPEEGGDENGNNDHPSSSPSSHAAPPRPKFLDATPENPRRDVNTQRLDAMSSVIDSMKERLFNDVYKPRHNLMLGMLMCHPDWQRRGAGRALLEWGIRKAEEEDNEIKVISLFASPIGENLYKKLGFRQAGEVERVQIEGEEEFVDIKGMVLEVGGNRHRQNGGGKE